ncbi:hypothetical protein L1N85_25045 [Paenibacillus alkaliterrae]|uniref:hypothetical protein n=1 Tax=Paenibacillus alkaliterrae TaxID=320909 RepID=UPI001F3A668A|nr:hypothetical protein [Paenibacillus alkaliterrae]MCF2941607.1 hypothetical protein [Paenibacillus alkaliterrae]
MTKQRWIENENIDPVYLDITTWPIVHEDKLDPKDREIFLTRKKAVELYMKNKQSIESICETTGLDRNVIRKFVKRCLSPDHHGGIWGFRGLIPRKRLKAYDRKSLPVLSDYTSSTSFVGSFSLLLKSNPSIQEAIDNLYLGRNKKEVRSPVIKVKELHKKFLELCTAAGIKRDQYPFITDDLGRRSLYRYVKELEQLHFGEASKRYGVETAQKARHTGRGRQNEPMIVRPLKRVQFDGHRIDCSIAIVFQTPEGDEIVEVLDRLWLLALIDVATRVVLGYHISYNKEYSAGDVLHCFKNAVMPKVRKDLTIPGLQYDPNGGFASELFAELEWALWDECLFDNGKANLANQVKDRLNRIIGCSVNAGPVALPTRRSYIERFFGTLEEYGYHRMINTTGSNPKDPRRKNPEDAAVKFRISADHLEQLTDVLISNYNGTQNEGINNLTPLQCLGQRLSRGMYPRVMPEENRQEVVFLSLSARRVVQGNIKEGKRPFVYYEGAEYRNDVLSRSPGLIGTQLDLLINTDDLRVIRAFLPDGSEFGTLTANGKWGVTPHSLQVRKQINKLRKLKLLHYTAQDDPIDCYHRYLQEQAKTNRTARNRLAALNRKTSTVKVTKDEERGQNNHSTPEVHPLEINQNSVIQINEINRKRFRTLTF